MVLIHTVQFCYIQEKRCSRRDHVAKVNGFKTMAKGNLFSFATYICSKSELGNKKIKG